MNVYQGLLCLVLLSIPAQLLGQACCSGGAPITGNLGLGATEPGSIQLQLTYDWNHLQHLFAENQRLDDQSRIRNTHTLLLEAAYEIHSNFSVSGLFPFVRQERIIETTQIPDITINQGMGDAILLLRWQKIQAKQQWILGAGPKIPLGSSQAVDNRGILLAADLQSGTGAWDLVFWGYYQRYSILRSSTNLNISSSFRKTGTNPRFNGSQSYRFGDEYQFQLGIDDQFFIHQLIIRPQLGLRYRRTGFDEIEGEVYNNTGGHWLSLVPSMQLDLSPHSAVKIAGTIPLFRHLTGTQLTTSYKITAGLYYRLGAKSKKQVPIEIGT